MKFKADEIVSVLSNEISQYRGQLAASEVGRVLEVGDGIARVYGLAGAMAGELLEFTRSGVRGMAFNLEENAVGVIILGDYLGIREGDEVKCTGTLLSVPVGEAMLGRVVDPLGNPLDGKGPILASEYRLVESNAPGVAERQPVKQPLQTGIKAIDAMTPVGRGQRELIIGDRKTGKTVIAIDTIINQREEDVICVYVAVGQKESTVATVIERLRISGALDYTIVVVASAAASAPLQYIAPYAGTAMAEYFMYKGRDTLCVYDDLSKQAASYRQLVTCSCVVLPVVKHTLVTCSTVTAACWNAPPSWLRSGLSFPILPMLPRSQLTGVLTPRRTPTRSVKAKKLAKSMSAHSISTKPKRQRRSSQAPR
jgi:F-type H+-transporting ATPase subunit alpha